MVSTKCEPITKVSAQSPQRGPGAELLVRGQSPAKAERLFALSQPEESTNLS